MSITQNSIKQHEIAALHELEQMMLAAKENIGESRSELEKSVTNLENCLQQIRQKYILDEKQCAMEAFREHLATEKPWQSLKAEKSGHIHS